MSQILNRLKTVDLNNSESVKDTLSAFFLNLLKHTETDRIVWLRSLEEVINRFPRYCVSHRTTIENHLVPFLDSGDHNSVIEVAKCAHALQQIKSSQEKSTTAKSNWREQTQLLCRAAHALLTSVFTSAVDIYRSNTDLQGNQENVPTNSPLSTTLYNISTVTNKTQNNATVKQDRVLCTRLKNVLILIQAMLVEIYPVAKPIRPQLILDVIIRTLSVSSGSSNNISLTDIVGIKIQALRTLDALVACLGPNLIPYSALVFRIATQALRWTAENASDDTRKVRRSAYDSLRQWLTTLHTHRPEGRSRWEDELTKHIVDDITPATHVVQLSMTSRPTKHLSKKAKRKLANTMLKESSLAAHMPGEKNKINVSEKMVDEIALAALECAETFLNVCGIFLKPETHKIFQERLVKECYEAEKYTDERVIGLVRALEASRSCTPPEVPPPTQYCLQLYSVLVNKRSAEISRFCSQALLNIRLHLHCSPPTINYALERPAEKKNAESKMKLSKRNREALESLLGSDKLPPNIYEDTISETEESPHKKARLEETDDKISISSDSDSSVEICDNVDGDDSSSLEGTVVLQHEISPPLLGIDTNDNENQDLEEVHDDTTDKDRPVSNETAIENIDDNRIDTTIEKNYEEVIEPAVIEENDVRDKETVNIHEAVTQLPFNTSNDTIDGEASPFSMEVAYDYPNTGADMVTVLEKIDDENLPSTNDTDDILITCGQMTKYSQENSDRPKSDDMHKNNEDVPKVNGINKYHEEVSSSDLVIKDNTQDNTSVSGEIEKCQTVKNVDSTKEVSIEDMLADFVDEVNENNVSQA